MAKNISIPDYYSEQNRIANTYNVTDNLAGCYICNFPDHRLCTKCLHAEKCENICEKECKEESK